MNLRDAAERQAKQATPHDKLIAKLLDPRISKTKLEHAAAREIERLRAALEKQKQVEPVAPVCDRMPDLDYGWRANLPSDCAASIRAREEENDHHTE